MKVLRNKIEAMAIASMAVARMMDKHELTDSILEAEKNRLVSDKTAGLIDEAEYQRKSISILTRFKNNNTLFINSLNKNYSALSYPAWVKIVLKGLDTEQNELKKYISMRNKKMLDAMSLD